MKRTSLLLATLAAGAMLASAGCNNMTLAGKPVNKLYELPKTGQLLVLVNDRPGYGVPLEVPPQMAMGITKHLNKYNAHERFISPEVIAGLKADPKEFSKLDVMTVARKTNADYVLFVDLYEFRAEEVSSGLITDGVARALVRVVDKNGNRMWPAHDGNPQVVETTVPPMTVDQQSLADVKRKLAVDLTTKIGRMFHDYTTDMKDLNPR